MRALRTLSVLAGFPAPFERFDDLIGNAQWCWHQETIDFFRRIDPDGWERANHSPWKMLAGIDHQTLLERLSADEMPALFHRALERLDTYLHSPSWFQQEHAGRSDVFAYFSAEFGLHESIALYSGGLGVLSGDHTKSASDLGLPFVGVGLLYQMGYFRQRLTLDGTQHESYEYNDPSSIPIRRVRDAQGHPLRVTIALTEGEIHLTVWRMQVGRVPLYLLDTNIPDNASAEIRNITGYLYGGDTRMRIMQEIVLGIGGMRMLHAIGIDPSVTHCNEGHSAFLLLERTREGMTRFGLSFEEAARLTAAGSVFTTHTPVPAGHDVFDRGLVEQYLGAYAAELGLTVDRLMALGRVAADDASEGFSMTVLALRLTSGRNGVSSLHGDVSRDMWKEVWPGWPTDEVPIIGITNGVHTLSFIAPAFAELYDRYVAADWRDRIPEREMWDGALSIPDEEIWEASRRAKSAMIDRLRRRNVERQTEMYARSEMGRDDHVVLDPDALTIGFARRFATYKRATLLFRDHDRAYRLFTDPERPVQLLLAGKAHPKDEAGKKFIRDLYSFIRESGLENRILFIEDYDIGVARAMVQGCDLWLNSPRRPMEASGTSGMKAAVNGTLNLSILDGWFPEAYDGTNGFAFGETREFLDTEYQDEIESRDLYRVLEDHVLPLYYTRDADGIPHGWNEMQKRSIATMAGVYSSDRMVREYTDRFYIPAADRYASLLADGAAGARSITSMIAALKEIWNDVRVDDVTFDSDRNERVTGETVGITAHVSLGRVSPDHVRVEAFCGPIDDERIVNGDRTILERREMVGGKGRFEGTVPLKRIGQTGITVRVVPAESAILSLPDVGLVTWG